MPNIVHIRNINGNIFKEIKYYDFDDLSKKLQVLILSYDADICIILLINDNILNNFDTFNNEILTLLNNYDITIVFNQKKELYCLDNKNGEYILDWKNNNYSKLFIFIKMIVMILL